MKVTQFEGTPEEFKAVANLFGTSPVPNGSSSTDENANKEPTIEPQAAIRCMLTRIPISNGQLAVYKALADGRLEYHEFLRRTERPAEKMAGVLGAIGRRINHTKEIHQAGLPGNASAILKWEKQGGKEYIMLTHDALEALKTENII